jgi:rSAM/selenodomain-associated transferase 1
MPETAIGVMAKYPQAGRVKTRLAVDVGEKRALEVYRLLLTRTVGLICELKDADYFRAAFVTPAEYTAAFHEEHPGFDLYGPQDGVDLGARMRRALSDLLAIEDIGRAMLIGTDAPQLNRDTFRQAASALEEHDLVLGPTVDGGYYLIGVREIRQELFEDVRWGTSSVLARTLEIAEEIGLSVLRLEEMRDLDDADDLKQLVADGVIGL